MADYYVDIAAGNDSNAGTAPGSGNAWATLGKAASAVTSAANRVFTKASGEYDTSVAIVFDSGISVPNSAPLEIIGYGTSIFDGIKPTIKATGTISGSLLSAANANTRFANFLLNGNGLAATGLALNFRGGSALGIDATACTVGGIATSQNNTWVTRCRIYSMTAGSLRAFHIGNGGIFTDLVAHDNPCIGFDTAGTGSGAMLSRVIATRCTYGASIDNWLENGVIANSVFYKNVNDGVLTWDSYEALCMLNSILVSNGTGGTGYGLKGGYTKPASQFINRNAYFGNATGAISGFTAGPDDVGISSNPFVSPDAAIGSLADAWANFTLKPTGDGATLRAAGFGVPNLDIGAVQSASSGGGSGLPLTFLHSGGRHRA